jgi:predicted dinucleotide-binding enzyme
MRIGIVGSGHIGGTLTRRLAALGHDVTVANSRGPESLQELASTSGATAGTVEDAVRDAELVVVAVPLLAVPDLPKGIFSGKVVVDANNYYPERDGVISELGDDGMTSSQWVASHLEGARVVKAFNNIMASHLMDHGRPAEAPDRIALPVASDDADAAALVSALVEDLGFDAVDAGGLADSWRQQPGTPVYGTDGDADGVRRGLGEAGQQG